MILQSTKLVGHDALQPPPPPVPGAAYLSMRVALKYLTIKTKFSVETYSRQTCKQERKQRRCSVRSRWRWSCINLFSVFHEWVEVMN